MSNRRTALEIEEARSDTTPMIDVVFLMIVFFVCIVVVFAFYDS